jgi:hypothetical protein
MDRDWDPEQDPDPYPFQPNLKLNENFLQKISNYSKTFQFGVLSKILKIITPMMMTRKRKQSNLELMFSLGPEATGHL